MKSLGKVYFILLFLGLILTICYYVFNLSYGNTLYEKLLMAGCTKRLLVSKEIDISKSKNTCECLLDFLLTKYSVDKIQDNDEFDKIIANENEQLLFCKKKYINLENTSVIDTTKRYYKIRHMNDYKDNNIELMDGYVDRETDDTIFNEFRYYTNGVLDTTKSKFVDLKITGKKDSIMDGRISFYSPRDTLPKSAIQSRAINFVYLQEENNCVVVKKIHITSNTNTIKFPYRNFRNFNFIGYLSDTRVIHKPNTTEYVDVTTVEFAVDSRMSTDNVYIQLLKK